MHPPVRLVAIDMDGTLLPTFSQSISPRNAKALRDAQQAGITPESLSRFERGRSPEFGARKLLAVLAVLGMELDVIQAGQSGNLDQLRKERNLASDTEPRGRSKA